MNDIFSNDIDLGSDNESGLTADATVETAAPTDSTAVAEPAPSTDQATADQGEQVQDGTQQEQSPVEGSEPVPTDAEKLEQEIEVALADPKTPKWFKNAVENVYKPKVAEANTKLETYSQYGSPEEIQSRIDLLNGLETVRSNPKTGMPERTTEPFVKSFYEKDPQGAYQLVTDLVTLPSPYTQGRTVLEEVINGLGIDPARIPDVQKFAANGYQMQASSQPPPDQYELQQLPEALHATFGKLDPSAREELMMMSEETRDRTLQAYKNDFENEERQAHEQQTQAQREQEAKVAEQTKFVQAVETKGDENFQQSGEAVLNGFVESLVKQAGMNSLDGQMIANTVLNAYEPTVAGRATAAALKQAGIELDPAIPSVIAQLQEKSKHIAYYQITGDQAALSKAVGEQVELQQKILAKGNKIVAQLAQKRAGATVGQVKAQSDALAQTQNSRHAVAGAGGKVNSDFTPTYDLSEEGYHEVIAQDPHFRR